MTRYTGDYEDDGYEHERHSDDDDDDDNVCVCHAVAIKKEMTKGL